MCVCVCVWGGGGGGATASQLKKVVDPRRDEKKFFSLSRGVWLPQKILKIKYLRLAKNVFPKIFQLIFLVSQEL